MSTTEVTDVDELISCDSANVEVCKSALADVSPCILEAIAGASSLYVTLNHIYAQSSENHFVEVEETVERLGLDSDGLLLDLAKTDPTVRGVVDRFVSRDARALLLARLGVLHTQAFADFFRMRVTAPLAYLRIQAESVALIVLMSREPSIAQEWSDIRTDEDGRRFYRSYQNRVVGVLQDSRLLNVYELASGGAVHSRFAALARSMSITHTSEDGKFRREYLVRAQEFDPDDPVLFYVTVAHALRVQENIFRELVRSVPEIDDPIFTADRIPRFAALVDQSAAAVQALRAKSGDNPSDAA